MEKKVEKITFAEVFRKLFANVTKVENSLPGYKEWEKTHLKKEAKKKKNGNC